MKLINTVVTEPTEDLVAIFGTTTWKIYRTNDHWYVLHKEDQDVGALFESEDECHNYITWNDPNLR